MSLFLDHFDVLNDEDGKLVAEGEPLESEKPQAGGRTTYEARKQVQKTFF